MVASSNTFITYSTMFRAKRFPGHTLNTECLAIQSSFRSKVLNDLYRIPEFFWETNPLVKTYRSKFIFTGWLRTGSRVQGYGAEEIVSAESNSESEQQIEYRMILCFFLRH